MARSRAVEGDGGSSVATQARSEAQLNTGALILEAAVDLFAERGYHATSVRDLASALTIKPAALYHWFDSKEMILVTLQEAFIADLRDVVEPAIEHQLTPEARLAAAVREHVSFHGLNSKAAFATDSEIRALSAGNRARIISLRDAYQNIFIELIQAGVDKNVLQVTDVRIASYALLLQCTGVAMWFDPRGGRSLDEIGEIHVELVLGSLRASRSTIARAITATAPEQ